MPCRPGALMAADTNSSPRGTRRRAAAKPLIATSVAVLDFPLFPRRRVGLASVCSLVAALLLGGCVSSGFFPPGGGVDHSASPPTVTTGQVATTADVSGWTGLDIDTAMPISLSGLLAMIVWLSH